MTLNQSFNIEELVFNDQGLIPVIVQDVTSKEVLMMAYMNEEALTKTIQEKQAWYYSRKRQSLWRKGETSGHYQAVKGLYYDCDGDTLLMMVEQTGVACHKNQVSCFHNPMIESTQNQPVITELFNLIKERKVTPVEGSYTNYLFEKGIDKILKKLGEETSEVIIAAKNDSQSEMIYELSDLVYHGLVLMAEKNLTFNQILETLAKRSQPREKTSD